MNPANYGKRIGALLIDASISYGIGFVLFLIGLNKVVNDRTKEFGIYIMFFGPLFGLFIVIFNKIIKEGRTGQSIGKSLMGIYLVDAITGMPLGPRRCFLREFVSNLLNVFTSGVFGILDYLWPLWDIEKERLMDKVMASRVVESGEISSGVSRTASVLRTQRTQ